MSAGVVPSTPIIVPILVGGSLLAGGGALAGGGYLAYRLHKLKKKVLSAKEGEEIHFSELEAKIIEIVIRKFNQK